MKKIQRLVAVTLYVGLIASCATVVLAGPPVLPSSFYGVIKINGVSVPTGTLVTAWISGTQCAEAAVTPYGSDSVYGLNVPADDPDTLARDGGVAGDPITISVRAGGQVIVRTAIWQSGSNVRVDLAQHTKFLPIARRGF